MSDESIRVWRRRGVHLVCLCIMLPVLPLYFLRQGLQAGVDFIDWITEGRAWCQPLLRASDWIENRFASAARTEGGSR